MSDFQAVLQDSQKTSKSGTASGQSLPDWFGEAHPFTRRHIGPGSDEIQAMLSACGVSSLETLADQAVPTPIRLGRLLNLPQVRNEHEALCELKTVASRNQCFRSYIGMGYYDCVTPPVIQRNILENPGWYTQYTPYQAEIAQGRLEALLNFQTMIRDLTGMDIANASMLDEGTAAAEAMTMALAIKRADGRHRFFVDQSCHPQTIDVIRTRATPQGIEVVVGDWRKQSMESGFFGVLVQYPATDGAIPQYDDFAKAVHAGGAMLVVAADLLSLVVLRPPGAFGADIVVGNTQRFGLPMGFGGPHAAFFATQDAYKRLMPGRLIGVSKDAQGKAGLRLALQTREQHIRREKATSNICTAQVLLAIMASMYAVYHGPDGLRRIARRVHGLAKVLGAGIAKMGFHLRHAEYFDTLCVDLGTRNADAIIKLAASHRMNLRKLDAHTIGISVDETTRPEDVAELWQVFNADQPAPFSVADLAGQVRVDFDSPFQREGEFLKHAVFNTYHSETEMLRYIKRLESRDLSLTVSMTPLGSCTMKLNAAVEMLPITWPEFGRMHPFAPADQTAGFQALFADLEKWLAEITGFAAVSLQPNAGSQGEYTGLLTIRNYHHSRGQGERNICLIPQSAHGTNPASSAMAGFHVMPVACDEAGNIDLADLRAKATANAKHLAALMVTYPSTHGVFEEEIKDICHIIHEHGGQVYMDGANMNAQVGLCRPGDIGADVCHLNLHKTFAIPHGGGGPGVGPICVASHLVPFLPGHAVAAMPNRSNHGAVCSAPYGSASILPISWTYIKLMGPQGLASATKVAILNANYVARRLNSYYPVLYKGKRGWVAHECILDLHAFKSVTVEDVAKRLMDFGFHAPTISFPVPGTIMVEPTESESKMELDRFCDAMIAIHKEIQDIESGAVDRINNPIKQAPHPAAVVMADTWGRPYSRTQAAYPAPWLREFKFWPAVSRIDNVYGDRNPLCTCEGMDAYRA